MIFNWFYEKAKIIILIKDMFYFTRSRRHQGRLNMWTRAVWLEKLISIELMISSEYDEIFFFILIEFILSSYKIETFILVFIWSRLGLYHWFNNIFSFSVSMFFFSFLSWFFFCDRLNTRFTNNQIITTTTTKKTGYAINI